MDWPAGSVDLKPTDNLWSLLAHAVYVGGREFESVSELKERVMKCWENIGNKTLAKIVSSMPKDAKGLLSAGVHDRVLETSFWHLF